LARSGFFVAMPLALTWFCPNPYLPTRQTRRARWLPFPRPAPSLARTGDLPTMGIYHSRSNSRTNATGVSPHMLTLGVCALALSIAPGCRSGATAMSAPSWWSFGGSAAADPSKLTSAPPFDGKIAKPSESATPYPTTTTPKGYEVTEATKGAPAPSATAAAPAEPTAVTYGTRPPAAPATASSPSTIAPQVGPYASLTGQPPASPASEPPLQPITPTASQPPSSAFSAAAPPAAQPSPSSAFPATVAQPATTSPGGSFPATAGYEPAARMADSRGADPYASPPPPAAAAAPAAAGAGASRYSSAGSRFGGGAYEPPPAAPATPAMTPPPAVPSSTPATPASMPAAPPTRRPDPGYRPGSTSSYRPSQAIIADDPRSAPAGVRTASYEEPASALPR